MRILVLPKYERSRSFKHLVAAMQFAEAARKRQGPITGIKRGAVEVHIYDGYTPHVVALYGASGRGPVDFMWTWGYAKR